MKKTKVIIIGCFMAAFVVSGTAFAATEWSGDNTFTGTVNWFKKGVKIGQQGSGGVTFFNGTIVNQTTTDGADNPVTFGDNVRIDGAIQRGTNLSTDTWNVKIADGVEVDGASTFKETVTFENGASGLDYAASSHNHDSTYYTETESDGRFVSKSSPSWDTRTGYVTIAGADFISSDTAGLEAVYSALGELSPPTNDHYVAPVNLPHGATVTGVKVYGVDDSASAFSTALYKNSSGTSTIMATVNSTGDTSAYQNWSDTSITSATIDASSNGYALDADFNGATDQKLGYVIITYTYTSPY